MVDSNRRQAGIVSNRVSSPMICVRPYWVYPGGSRAFAPLTLMSIVGAKAIKPPTLVGDDENNACYHSLTLRFMRCARLRLRSVVTPYRKRSDL